MRLVLQRVTHASVTVESRVVAAIGPGLLLLLGVAPGDDAGDVAALAAKVAALRVFSDAEGRMNLALRDTGGEALVASQFTLFGDVRKGNRPSFTRAAPPAHAEALVADFVAELSRQLGRPVAAGIFGADMAVSLLNDGPVTLILDTRAKDF